MYKRVVQTSSCIRERCTFCIIVLYKHVVYWLYFSMEKNQFITGKRTLEEQHELSQRKILKLTSSQHAIILANGSLNNDLTLTIQNIDVTQETKA